MSDPFDGQSIKPTAYAVHCPKHGQVYLTPDEYMRQLGRADDGWSCPVMYAEGEDIGLCGRHSEFDDENYETFSDKDPNAVALGRKGGKSRSPAKLAALARARGKRKLSDHPGAVYQRDRRARLKSKPTRSGPR